MALTCWLRTIAKDVAQMAATAVAMTLSPGHEEPRVHFGANGVGQHRIEGRPARTAVVLVVR